MTVYDAAPVAAPDGALRDRILAAVEQGFAAQVAFTQDLVRYPSLRGQEPVMPV